MNKFYVYVYLDPRKEGEYNYGGLCFNAEPFYVGKGSGYRCNVGIKDDKNYKSKFKHNKIKSIFRSGFIPIIHKLYENLTEAETIRIEIDTIELIGKVNDGKGPLVNITNGGDGMSGYKHKEEWKSKLSKPIIQYDLNYNFVNEYLSIKEASLQTGILKQNIGACINGRYKKSGGFIWKYKDPMYKLQGHLKSKFNMPKHKPETKEKIGQSNLKSIIQYDLNGHFIKEWKSIKDASVNLNILQSGISNCCLGVYRTSSGFIWRYNNVSQIKVEVPEKSKKILQYDKNLNLIREWSSAKEVEYQLGFNQINIRSCCRGINKTCKGCIWKYKT